MKIFGIDVSSDEIYAVAMFVVVMGVFVFSLHGSEGDEKEE